jgi:hypothetical protein
MATIVKWIAEEVFKVFVVSVDGDRVRRTFKIMPPVFDSSDDSKEFFIVNGVVELSRREFGRKVGNGVELA